MADSCLDDEVLAAYVDGGLTAEERTRVERHLASCQDCFAVFTETVKTVQAMQDEGVADAPAPTVGPITTARRRRVVQWVAAGAALATAAALVLVVWWPKAERPELVDLVAAVGERRPVEGRLTGGFKFGPIESPTRGAEASTEWRVLAAAGKLEEEARGTQDARLLGALGTAHLVTRDVDSAVKYYDQAIDLAPDDPLLRTDRAAALLARGDAAGDSGAADFVRALDDAARAVLKDPTRLEALFNKAMALQRMHLEDQEREAWQAYLALDATSAWAADARRRIAEIEAARKSRSRWEDHREEVLAAADRGDRERVDRAAEAFAENVRTLVEDEFLPSWGEAVMRGDHAVAATTLVRAHVLAASIAAVNHDPLALHAANAAMSDPRVSSGYAAWGRGRRMYAEDRIGEARIEFERARALLGLGNAIGLAADLYVQIARFIAREYAATGPEFDRIAGVAAARAHWNLLGSAERMRGLVHGYLGEFDRSLARHHVSLACYSRTHEPSNSGGAHSAISESYRYLGNDREAWQHFRIASRLLERGSLRRRWVTLSGGSNAALDAGLAGAALTLQTAIVTVTATWGIPGARAEALLARARLKSRLSDVESAATDLTGARDLLSAIEVSQRRLTEAELWGTEALLLEPPAAIEKLSRAIEFWRPASSAKASSLYLRRGLLYKRVGNLERAANDFESGIELFETQLRTLADHGAHTSFIDENWRLFEALALLELRRDRPDKGLLAWSRGKGRSLHGRNQRNREASPSIATIQHSVPHDAALLAFMVADGRIVAWLVTRDSFTFTDIAMTARDVTTLINSLDTRTGTDAWSAIYDGLIRPLGPALQSTSRLFVVADPPLAVVPFAGLFDSTRGRYLVEDAAVSMIPGVEGWRGSRPARRETSRTAVVIASPKPAEGLPALPEASREAESVSALYTASLLLQGQSAEPSRVLEEISHARVVHFAGHAISRSDFPFTSRLLLDGGVILAGQLQGLRMSQPTVVLSACTTLGSATSRGEGPLGLAQSLIAGGAREVVATLGKVPDLGSHDFMVAFHTAFRKYPSAAIALQRAQIQAIDQQRAATVVRPLAWASFVVVEP